jgi:hypothetical protein
MIQIVNNKRNTISKSGKRGIEMDKDRRSELLAGEIFEMISLGWTDEEAREDENAFFDRIGDYAEGLTKEEVWEIWENAIEITQKGAEK